MNTIRLTDTELNTLALALDIALQDAGALLCTEEGEDLAEIKRQIAIWDQLSDKLAVGIPGGEPMIGKYFIDTGTIRQAETVSQDERVGRVVAVHPDCGAAFIMENEELDTLWYAERASLKPITEDEAMDAYLRLAEDNCSAWR